MVPHADKGVFVLLYLSDHMQTKVTVKDLEEYVQGPCGYESEFPASRIIQVSLGSYYPHFY